MKHLGTGKQIFLLLLSAGLLAFVVFIQFFATREQLLFIGTMGIDKMAHTAGGLFLAAFLEWRFRRAHLLAVLAFILGVAFGWEALEFLFDADTGFFYANAFNLWFLDSLGDVIAAYLGGYGYWVFGMDRPTATA